MTDQRLRMLAIGHRLTSSPIPERRGCARLLAVVDHGAGPIATLAGVRVGAGWSSAPLEITDGSGQQVFALPMPDGVDLLVIDTTATRDAPAESHTEQQWTVSRDGEEIGTVIVSLPP